MAEASASEQELTHGLGQTGTGPIDGTAAGEASFPASRWLLGLLVAAVVGWLGMHYWPSRYELAPELMTGTVANNPALQLRASVEGAEVNYKNGRINLMLVGVAFGAVPPLVCFFGGVPRVLGGAVLGALLGIGCGVVAMWAAVTIQGQFAPAEGADPLAETSMTGDLLAFVAIGVLSALPAAGMLLMGPGSNLRQKAVAVPLAGGVAGALTPVIASLVLHKEKTDVIPPTSMLMSGFWLLLIAVAIYALGNATGAKKPAKA